MSKMEFLAMEAQARGKGLGLEEEEGAFYSGEGEGAFLTVGTPCSRAK